MDTERFEMRVSPELLGLITKAMKVVNMESRAAFIKSVLEQACKSILGQKEK